MCEPATLIAIGSVVATVASTATSIVATQQQSKAQQAQYNYQAKLEAQNAAQEKQSGIEEARLKRLETQQKIAQQQAGMAANGLDIGSGTALDTVEDTATMGELDALTTQYNSQRMVNNYQAQANLDKLAAKNVQKTSTLNSIGTALSGTAEALGGLGKVNDKWQQYKNK